MKKIPKIVLMLFFPYGLHNACQCLSPTTSSTSKNHFLSFFLISETRMEEPSAPKWTVMQQHHHQPPVCTLSQSFPQEIHFCRVPSTLTCQESIPKAGRLQEFVSSFFNMKQ
jgi:hypothetical protein